MRLNIFDFPIYFLWDTNFQRIKTFNSLKHKIHMDKKKKKGGKTCCVYERNYMMSSASTLTRNSNNFFLFLIWERSVSLNDCYFPAYFGSMREEINSFMEINRTTNNDKHTRISLAKHNDHEIVFPPEKEHGNIIDFKVWIA